jgi:geranylgeranyl transferase type-2 subunit beta
MSILNRLHWISAEKLTEFILSCEDKEGGGFSDRPGNLADVFHSLFAIAGLSLLAADDSIQKVNPVYCMSQRTVSRIFTSN